MELGVFDLLDETRRERNLTRFVAGLSLACLESGSIVAGNRIPRDRRPLSRSSMMNFLRSSARNWRNRQRGRDPREEIRGLGINWPKPYPVRSLRIKSRFIGGRAENSPRSLIRKSARSFLSPRSFSTKEGPRKGKFRDSHGKLNDSGNSKKVLTLYGSKRREKNFSSVHTLTDSRIKKMYTTEEEENFLDS